jgi:hypothetical protein
LDWSLDQSLSQEALCKALVTHCPEIHHSDQGVQYAANRYVELLQAHAHRLTAVSSVGILPPKQAFSGFDLFPLQPMVTAQQLISASGELP